MRAGGRYAELFTLQATAYRDGPPPLDSAVDRDGGSASGKPIVEESL